MATKTERKYLDTNITHTSTKFKSTKALDELFTYSYKLRRNGIDPTVIMNIVEAIMVGAPAVEFSIENDKLTKEQEELIKKLENNGFDVTRLESAIIVKDIHFDKLRSDIDKYLGEINNE